MNVHVYALKRSGNNVLRKWITQRRLMAIFGNVRLEHMLPGEAEFDDAGLKRPLPFPLSRHAVRASGSASFKALSRLPIAHYLGTEDRFVPLHELHQPKTVHVVLVRHIHHCLASRIQRAHQGSRLAYPIEETPELHRILDVWVQHVNLLLDPPAGVVGIYYDRWLQDEEYRRAIGQKLGVRKPSRIPAKRGTGGGGSSFDGMSAVGDPSAMLNRSNQLNSSDLKFWERCVNRPDVLEAIARLESTMK